MTKVSGTDTTEYAWDYESRLTQVTLPNGTIVNYKYDALGRRIQRTTSTGVDERYVYDGQNVIQDLDSSSSVITNYLNGPGIDNHLRQTNSATGVSYFLTDHLGSTVGLTDSSANLIEQISYDSFGNQVASSRTRYTYTGRERDADTGLFYNRARFYDPQLGRFIAEDPIGFSGGDINLYGYVWQNPTGFRDPLGLDGWGNDVADWLDKKIDVAHDYWRYDSSEAFSNGVNKTIADLAHGTADIMRVGGGLGSAIYDDDNGYGRAANIARDITRGAAIFGLVGGPASRVSGALEIEFCEGNVPTIKPGSANGVTAGKRFPTSVRDQALAEDPTQTCVYCGGQGSELDHAIPRSKGGNATLDNAQWACRHCNASKGAGTYPKTPPPGYTGPWPPQHWK